MMPEVYNPACDSTSKNPQNFVQEVGIIGGMKTLSERLQSARKAQGMSQTALAKASGVSQQAISLLECGDALESKHIIPLSAALRVNPHWLQSGEGPREAPDWDQVIDLGSLPEPGRTAAASLCRALQDGEISGEQLAAFVRAILLGQKKNS